MKPEVAAKEQHRVRFLREAQAAAKVEHDHICPIYQVGEDNGVPFIAMPFLKGESLDARLKRQKPLPIEESVRIARQVAEGLAVAHDAGLVHRDIKPANIWLETGRVVSGGVVSGGVVSGDVGARADHSPLTTHHSPFRVKILDFGLARIQTDETHLTASGAIMGTPAYMAPEQARSLPVDHRADLFSLGVMLYEMTTGRRPFTGSDTMSMLMSLAVDNPTAPNLINFAIPSELSDLIVKLLSKSPEHRPASARAVADALMNVLLHSTQPIVEALPGDPGHHRGEFDFADDATNVEVPLASRAAPDSSSRGPKRERSRGRPIVVAAVALVVLIGASFGAYRLFFETKNGTLIVEVNDKETELRFKNGELQILGKDGKSYTLTATERKKSLPFGDYEVHVVGTDGLDLDTKEFTLKKGGQWIIRVTAKAPALATSEPAKEFTNSIGMKLVRIPAGKFWMGSSDAEVEKITRSNPPYLDLCNPKWESPRHEVEISRPFHLGVYEVTVGQFRQFVRETRYKTTAERTGQGARQIPGADSSSHVVPGLDWRNPGYPQTDDYPVTEVSWADAKAFCDWLSKKEGRRYDLPTEAQWEYACRAGTATRFSTGDDEASLKGYANVADATVAPKGGPDSNWGKWAARFKDGYAQSAPVGKFRPNAFGLYDMHGNVWDWCRDRFDGTYYSRSPRRDPLGPVGNGIHPIRGGSWFTLPIHCRSTAKVPVDASSTNNDIGFRVVLQQGTASTADMPATDDLALFNGKDLSGWIGKPGHWKVENGAIVGSFPAGVERMDTHLYSKKSSETSKPSFQLKLTGEKPNSGFLPRAAPLDAYTLFGPVECDFNYAGWGAVRGRIRRSAGKPLTGDTGLKAKEFNDVLVHCVGKRLTVAVNGTVTADQEFDLPAEGRVGWQLWPEQQTGDWKVTIRNIRFRDLSKSPTPPATNHALEFDGAEKTRVAVPSFFLNPKDSVTIEVYAAPSQAAVQWCGVAGVPYQMGINVDGSKDSKLGTWRIVFHEKPGTAFQSVVGPPAIANQKVHVAAVWNRGKMSLFLDGKRVASKTFKSQTLATPRPDEPFQIGPGFRGTISAVRVSNVARYDNDFTPEARFTADKNTLALYHFDEGSGDVLKDSSGHGRDGKIVGAKWVRADSPASGKPVDLLKLIDIQRDTVSGRWKMVDGKLVGGGKPLAVFQAEKLQVPYSPGAEYDLEVVVERSVSKSDGEHQFSIFVVGPNLFHVHLDWNWHKEGKIIHGLGMLNGKAPNENETTVAGDEFSKGKPVKVQIRVRRDSVVVLLNGKERIGFHGDPKQLTFSDFWKVPTSNRLGFGITDGEYSISEWKLTSIGSASSDPDRRAAEWVLSIGGKVTIEESQARTFTRQRICQPATGGCGKSTCTASRWMLLA